MEQKILDFGRCTKIAKFSQNHSFILLHVLLPSTTILYAKVVMLTEGKDQACIVL